MKTKIQVTIKSQIEVLQPEQMTGRDQMLIVSMSCQTFAKSYRRKNKSDVTELPTTKVFAKAWRDVEAMNIGSRPFICSGRRVSIWLLIIIFTFVFQFSIGCELTSMRMPVLRKYIPLGAMNKISKGMKKVKTHIIIGRPGIVD